MRKVYLIIAYLLTHVAYLAAEEIVVFDADLVGGESYTWTADNVYIVDGYVFLEEGGVLTVEPGTVIKGMSTPTTADPASALIISRGAKIFAVGTASAPIIFTTSLDNTDDTDDLLPTDRGLWGGLVILGSAPGGFKNEANEFNIEGIPTEGYGEKALYGGDVLNDTSGMVQYVSIRHGGAAIAPDNEINGLTLGGVGSGTVMDHIEIFANADDGIEWFGGTVSIKYAVVSFCGDEAFDYDQSWAGNGQFLFSLTGDDTGERGFEIDGSEAPSLNPKTVPLFSNVTQIGSGSTSDVGGNDAFRMKADGSGKFYNSIWTEFSGAFLRIDDTVTHERFQAGDIVFENNILFNFGKGGNELDGIIDIRALDPAVVSMHLAANNNTIADPQLRGLSWEADGGLDPRPVAGAPALTGAVALEDAFFDDVPFMGAFGSTNWAANWTALSSYGVFAVEESGEFVIKDEDLLGGQTYNWTANNTYILDGYVFLEEGGVLNIEAGTIIKGMSTPSTADPATALIISRGASIMAAGTAEAPIIFTTSLDDVTDSEDLLPTDRGLWGGVVILGAAPGGFKNEAIEFNIEGIPTEGYGDKALYGGEMADDNSGVLQYISIRHGGAAIAPDNEINGLTLGGVGAATTIDHIEVFANADDGIEWFGGNVSVRYAAVAFCGDEAFDYDQSWGGKGQFLFSITGDDTGERGFEIDGSEAPSLNPKAVPVFSNVTQIGAGSASEVSGNDGFRMKADGSGKFYNSIWTEFSGAFLRIDDTVTYERFQAGDIVFENNVMYNFGNGGNDLNGILDIRALDAAAIAQHISENNNRISDPQLRGIGWTTDGGLDPRPQVNATILNGAISLEDDFFVNVSYIGAFGEENWAEGWSALSDYGVFGDLDVTSVKYQHATNGLAIKTVSPAIEEGRLFLDLPSASAVKIYLYDVNGRQLRSLDLDRIGKGVNNIGFDIAGLQSGLYVVIAETEVGTVSDKFIIN